MEGHMYLFVPYCRAPGCDCSSGLFKAAPGDNGQYTVPPGNACENCLHAHTEHHVDPHENSQTRNQPRDGRELNALFTSRKRALSPDATRPQGHSHAHPPANSTPVKPNRHSGIRVRGPLDSVKKRVKDAMDLLFTSTSSQLNSAREGRDVLASELDGHVYLDVPGLDDHFLGPYPPDQTSLPQGAWEDPPDLSEAVFVPWLVDTLNRLGGAGPTGRQWRNSTTRQVPSGYSNARRPDFCLVTGNTISWETILVVGEHQSEGSSVAASFLKLADYASQVLSHQPLRLQVHAVHSYNTGSGGMRLFVFDRGGAVGSQIIHNKSSALTRLATSYAKMAPALLGMATGFGIPIAFMDGANSSESGPSRFVPLPDGGRALLGKTICRRPGIISRATYCALAQIEPDGSKENEKNAECPPAEEPGGVIGKPISTGPVLVKFSWRSAARAHEGIMLEHAANRGTVAIAAHVTHFDVTDLVSLRRGWGTTGTAFPFAGGVKVDTPPGSGTLFSHSTGSLGSSISRGSSGSGSGKGKLRSSARRINMGSGSRPSDRQEQVQIQLANRILTCTVMSTIGKPVEDCVEASHIAHAMLGALIGHASLYFTAQILHRDISSTNIMYSPTPIDISTSSSLDFQNLFANLQLQATHGFVIDLDYAIQFPSHNAPLDVLRKQITSGAPHRTGTLQFISMGVLNGKPHAYHHDLESFLYVLIWVCLLHPDGYADEEIIQWYTGSSKAIWATKNSQMTDTATFEGMLSRFPPEYRGIDENPFAAEVQRSEKDSLADVARQWRDILFMFKLNSGDDEKGKHDGFVENGDIMNSRLYLVEEAGPGMVKRGLSEWDAFVQMCDALRRAVRRYEKAV